MNAHPFSISDIAMPHLLYVQASPRGERSASIEVADAFLSQWRTHHPDATIDTLDAWTTDLPSLDGDLLPAKYAGLAGEPLTPAQQEAWSGMMRLAERFRRADLLLFAVPMWNYTIPYRLKHLFDVISQKDILFTFDERGQNGLLKAKAVVVSARAVALGEDFPRAIWDHQTTYMRTWLLMVGVTDVHEIEIERGLMVADAAQEERAKGRARAEALAQEL